jgi:hypothetical protein
MSHDHNHDGDGVSRRKVLECMTWAGTGVLWTIAGGVPRSLGLVESARAAEASALTFLQISDSHIGFNKAANPHALATLEEAIGKIKALPVKPSFMIHTGDISHLSKPSEFDDAERIISQSRLDVHYVPGEHDFIDEDVKLYRERYGRGTNGAGCGKAVERAVWKVTLPSTFCITWWMWPLSTVTEPKPFRRSSARAPSSVPQPQVG